MRYKRPLFIFLAVSGLLFAGVAVAVRLAFPPEKIKKILVEEIQARLHRQVSLEGASVGILSGITLSGFRCSERPDFKSGTFVECEKLILKWSWRPLLRKRLEIKALELEAPKIRVLRHSDGKTYNFSDLPALSQGVASQAAVKEPAAKTPLEIKFSKLKITQGSFIFKDESPEQLEAAVTSFNFKAQGASLSEPIRLDLSARVSARPKGPALKPLFQILSRDNEMEFSGEVDLAGQSVQADHLTLRVPSLAEFKLRGKIQGFTSPKVESELNVSILSLAEVLNIASQAGLPARARSAQADGSAQLKLAVRGEIPRGNLEISLHADLSKARIGDNLTGAQFSGDINVESEISGNLSDFSLRLKADAGRAGFEMPGIFKKEAGSALTFDLDGRIHALKSADITKLNLSLQKSSVELQGKISNWDSASPIVDLRASSSQIDWTEVLKHALFEIPVQLEGSLNRLAFSFSGTPENFRFQGESDLKETGLAWAPSGPPQFQKARGIPCNFKMSGACRQGTAIDLETFNVSLGDWEVSGSARISPPTGAKKTVKASLSTSLISMQSLKNFLPSALSGDLEGTAQAKLSCSGTFPVESWPKILGWIEVKGLGADIDGLALADVSGRLSFNEESYELSNLSGKISGEPFQIKGSLKNPASPMIYVEGRLERLDLVKFAGEKNAEAKAPAPGPAAPAPPHAEPKGLPPAKISGKFVVGKIIHPNFDSGAFNFDWDLSQVTSKLDKVSGTAKLRTFGGEVMKVGAVEKILKIINPSLSILYFQDIGGDFEFKEGTMEIKDLWVESDKLSLSAAGKVRLPERTCDIEALARYSGAVLAASVPVAVTGPLSSPKIEKKSLSVFGETLQKKILRITPKSKEEKEEEKRVKEEKVAEKIEGKQLLEESRKEKIEEKNAARAERESEKSDERKQKEEDRLERFREKEELKKEKEQERLERMREREEEKRLKKEEEE